MVKFIKKNFDIVIFICLLFFILSNSTVSLFNFFGANRRDKKYIKQIGELQQQITNVLNEHGKSLDNLDENIARLSIARQKDADFIKQLRSDKQQLIKQFTRELEQKEQYNRELTDYISGLEEARQLIVEFEYKKQREYAELRKIFKEILND